MKTIKDIGQHEDRLKSLNKKEILIKEEYKVKLYNSFNSAIIFLPQKYWGKKVNIYEVLE